ncbi:hypothetical protein WICMUC_001813 [Wickerhamomyces mucosus]|uniref:non-specific serine/threonine protein kinase n=1 Tax=Wickerhamomyces mucosus TaxID=1378264 RepID=A0A9P8PTC5_9ASCO|nr:hypothetical protein WICMUC_001813 [Wickerhamomyces mucosus]
MGAELSLMAPTAPSIAVSAYIDVLDQIQYNKPLASSRFLKTIKAQDSDGSIVVKIFIKPNDNYELNNWFKILQEQKTKLNGIPNALPYFKIIETERAGYLIRQFIKTNAYDRISTRPFLKDIEKKWIVFQLLNTVMECHNIDVIHGDIKSENILVNSWNWLLLSDFAPFKPAYLPEDNPGIFSFYFDTSQRRSCYLAPERFITQDEFNTIGTNGIEGLTKKMDIFSLGCTIAEIFLEGSPIFTLSQLYKYRKGEFVPNLSGIKNPEIKELVISMIQLDPSKRKNLREYLEFYKEKIFLENFYTFIYEYFKSFNQDNFHFTTIENSIECDLRINRIYNDFDKIAYFLKFNYDNNEENDNKGDTESYTHIIGSTNELIPIKLSLPGIPKDYKLKTTNQMNEKNDELSLIFLPLIFTSLRNARKESSKIQALELILAFGEKINNEDKLDRCLPYIVSLLKDSSINVRATAIKILTQSLLLVDSITAINVSIFQDYIIPRIASLSTDPSTYVRISFAICLPYLAQISLRFYNFALLLREGAMDTSLDAWSESNPSTIFEVSKSSLTLSFETFATSILIDSDSNVKIALLRNILPLCSFFGQEKTNDLILSHLITYLNDRNLLLRLSFIESVIGLSIYVGATSLEHYILPLLVQTLTDPEELIVIKVLKSFQDLIKLGLIREEFIYDLLSTVAKLILHPNNWIKQFSLSLIADIAENLSYADLYCLLYPILRQYIEYDITDFSWETLHSICKRQISRSIYNLLLSWSLKAEDTLFWKQVRKTSIDVFGNRGLEFSSNPTNYIGTRKKPKKNVITFGNLEIFLSTEDREWIDRLIAAGLNSQELWKIVDFREYIYRVSRLSFRSSQHDDGFKDTIEIENFGVLPKTVFFDSKPAVNNEIYGVENLEERFQNFEIPDSNSNADDRLKTSINHQNSSDLTRVSTLSDEPSRSLIIGSSKATATLNTTEENAYGQLNSAIKKEIQRRTSIHAKKLKTTNYNNPPSLSHSYIGKDPYILNYLTSIKFESFLDEFPEFQKLNIPTFGTDQQWVFKGDLVSHLAEHKVAVNSIEVSPDYKVFISGDNDGVLKFWSISKLEANVSQDSLLSIDLSGSILKIKFLDNYNCFAVSTRDGYIRLMTINYHKDRAKFPTIIDGITILREIRLEDRDYALDLHFGSSQSNSVLYTVTAFSKILIIDIRLMQIESVLQNNPLFGFITSFAIDTNNSWLLIGTSKGVLSLWDLRFKVLLKSWKLSSQRSIKNLKVLPNYYQLNRKKGRFVTFTDGYNMIVFDISTGAVRELFMEKFETNDFKDFIFTEIKEDSVFEFLQDNKSFNESELLSTMNLIETQFGHKRKLWIIASTSKNELILWNLSEPESSSRFLQSALSVNSIFNSNHINPTFRVITEKFEEYSSNSKPIKRSKNSMFQEQQNVLTKKTHDVMTSLTLILKPYEMIICADRSGVINVYK